MSVPVAIEALQAETERFGLHPYLLTVSEDLRPHAVSCAIRWADGVIEIAEAGRRTRLNAAARPSISLLWSPIEPGGYSLIADGISQVTDAGVVRITPTSGVLHRSAAPRPEAAEAGCTSDCVPLLRP